MNITVNRNTHSPVFTDKSQELTIPGNTQLGATLITVTAMDEDKV